MELNSVAQKILNIVEVCWQRKDWVTITQIINDAEPIIGGNRELCALKIMCRLKEQQMQCNLPDLFRIEEYTFEALQKRLVQC